MKELIAETRAHLPTGNSNWFWSDKQLLKLADALDALSIENEELLSLNSDLLHDCDTLASENEKLNANQALLSKGCAILRAENEKLKKEFHSTRIIPDTPELIHLRIENEQLRENQRWTIEMDDELLRLRTENARLNDNLEIVRKVRDESFQECGKVQMRYDTLAVELQKTKQYLEEFTGLRETYLQIYSEVKQLRTCKAELLEALKAVTTLYSFNTTDIINPHLVKIKEVLAKHGGMGN